MSRWKWLSYATITGLLFVLTACGKKEQAPQSNDENVARSEGDATGAVDAQADAPNVIAELPALQITDADDGNRFIGELDSRLGVQGRSRLTGQGRIFANTALNFDPINPPARALIIEGTTRFQRGTNTRLRVKFQPSTGLDTDRAGGAGAQGIQANLDEQSSTENYQPIFENPYKTVKQDPLSTFSSSVDTASYSNLRARLNDGKLPQKDMVRIADMLNYFNYDYAGPKNDEPVAFSLEIAPCPWQPKHQLLRIGLKAKTIDKDKMPPRNLTFLIDTSGSMDSENRLPLVKKSLQLLVEQLTDKDMVSIVTYAGSAELLLTPTPGSKKDEINRVIESLNANGSTNGGGGIVMAYEQAKASFIKGGVNRVILATDGDFNVGVSSDAELVRLIEAKRETGIYLTVLGYGMGNLKDSKLEQLAHHGNGHYAYIDTLDEAKKVFVEQGGSLATVAKDVKLQVEFNPTKVLAYRLVGYENRVMRNEDFRDDTKDAGDMGSGHTCTALYEIVPVGEKVDLPAVEPLKYQTVPTLTDKAKSGEFLTMRMRYKHPETNKASEVEAALPAEALGKKVSNDFEFAACVASFGMLLRDSEYRGVATYLSTLETAEALLRDKKDAYREEFARLVRVALTIEQAQQPKK